MQGIQLDVIFRYKYYGGTEHKLTWVTSINPTNFPAMGTFMDLLFRRGRFVDTSLSGISSEIYSNAILSYADTDGEKFRRLCQRIKAGVGKVLKFVKNVVKPIVKTVAPVVNSLFPASIPFTAGAIKIMDVIQNEEADPIIAQTANLNLLMYS